MTEIQKKPIRKNRVSVVCLNCKRKKIKCDKKKPCNNCIKTRCMSSCQYLSPVIRYGNILNFDDSSQNNQNNILSKDIKNIGNFPELKETIHNPSLRDELYNLRSQIQTLEDILKPSEIPASGVLNSILDLKLQEFKKFTLMKRSDKLLIKGPMPAGFIIGSLFPKKLLKLMNNCLASERALWTINHGPPTDLPVLINAELDIEDIVDEIQEIVAPCRNAMLERLIYFKDHLNNLLYNGFVDMQNVFYWFSKFFIKGSSNTYIFINPQKRGIYVELSLIFSLVTSATLFSRHDPSVYFHILMSENEINTVNKLSTNTLALSKFYRKTTFSTLISLIIITENIYSYSVREADNSDESRSSYMLGTTLILALQVGLHRDPDSIDEYDLNNDEVYQLPTENWRILWSYLRLLDATCSSNSTRPLLINDNCSNIKCPSLKEASTVSIFADLQREAAGLRNSNDPISLNDIITLRKRYLNFFNSLGTFKELFHPNQDLSSSSYDLVAHKLKLKLSSLETLAKLNNYLSHLFLRRDLFPEEEITTESIIVLKEQAEFYEVEFMKTTIISWRLFKDICQSETVFRDQNFKYVVYFKSTYMKILYPTIVKFCVISTFNYFSKNRHITFIPDYNIQLSNMEIIKLSSLDYDKYESSLGSEYNNSMGTDEEIKRLFSNPKQTVTFMCELYASIAGCPLFADNYGYFCMLKLIAVFSCFVDSMLKILPSLIENGIKLENVLDETRIQIADKMRVGFIDMGFTLGENDETVNNLLNSIFNKTDPLCWFLSENFLNNDENH